MAVGVFDSGLGGLTVLDAVARRLPAFALREEALAKAGCVLAAVEEKLATPEEMQKNFTQQDIRDYSMLQIRAELMNAIGGQEARHRVLAGGDKQLQEAMKLFERAATMLAQRREMAPKIERGTQTKGM